MTKEEQRTQQHRWGQKTTEEPKTGEREREREREREINNAKANT
jgi:hypothetical protein